MSDPILMFEAVKRAANARLTGIAPDLLDQEARWVLDEFLRETRIWRRTLTVALVAGQEDYALDIEDYESVAGVQAVAYGAAGLMAGVERMTRTRTGAPTTAGMLTDRTIRVYPIPSAGLTEPLTVDVWLTMLVHVDQPPPDVILPFQDALLQGLLVRCYSIPNVAWTNLQLAGAHQISYEGAKARVRRQVDAARMRGTQFMRIPRF